MVELTLRKYDIVDGLDTVGKRGVGGCDECVLGKIRRGAVDGKRRARSSKSVAKTRPVGRVERVVPGQRLYSDFFGPLPEKTIGGGVAFGVALDGDTDYSELVVVKSRKAEEVTRWMEGIRAGLWTQQGSVMKELRVDGGSELLGALRVWARRHGIEVGTSAPGQHQHNPYAERYWLGLLNKLRVVFLQSGAPAFLAGEFAIALNTIRNMLPTAKSLVYGRSPFELHTGKKPDVSKCLPLGSMVIVHDYDPRRGGVRRNKYMPRGRLGVYVGPCEIGARVYLFDTHCVTRRRLEDLHSEPDRWPFKERGYDPASGFLIELERHAAMLRDRISRSYLGEEEEHRRRAGLAEAGADEERKASAGELVGDSREEDDGEGTEVPEEPVADKRAKELVVTARAWLIHNPPRSHSWKLCSTFLVRYSSESIYLDPIESVQFTFSSQEHLFNEIPTLE